MEDRLRAIQDKNEMTKKEFAESLGIPKSTLEGYMYGKRNPNKAFIRLVCDRFSVNEHWLLTGEGSMYAPVDREKAVYDAIKKARPDMPDSFPKDFAAAMAKLSEDDWLFIARMAQDMAKKARETQAAEQEKPPDDGFIYGQTAAKNAQPASFKMRAGEEVDISKLAKEKSESDEEEL